MIAQSRASDLLPVAAGGTLGTGGVSSGVGCLRRLVWGTHAPVHLQHVCGIVAVPSWPGSNPAEWFWRIIARCLSITAFTFVSQEAQHHWSSLVGPRREVSWWNTACLRLLCAKTALWPYLPYSTPSACRTVPALHDIVALPSQQTFWIPTKYKLLHEKCDVANTSTIYASTASSMVIRACFVRAAECLLETSGTILPEIMA
jgi:phosphatidylglycerophosphate synthase